MIGFFIALISGSLMSIQGVFNTEVTKTTGMWVSNMWVQFSAFLFAFLVWIVMGHDQIRKLGEVEPKYMLIGGLFGAGITYTVIKSMEKLGPAKAVLTIVISQVIVAYLIEILGLFGIEKQPVEWIRVLGMGIAILGLVMETGAF